MIVRSRIRSITQTTGTGPLLLSAAEVGYLGFDTIPAGDVTYLIEWGTGGWELGIGVCDPDASTLSRAALVGSAGNATLADLPAGAKRVSLVLADFSSLSVGWSPERFVTDHDWPAPPDTSGHAAVAAGPNAVAAGQYSVALGMSAGAYHDYSSVIGGAISLGPGLTIGGAPKAGGAATDAVSSAGVTIAHGAAPFSSAKVVWIDGPAMAIVNLTFALTSGTKHHVAKASALVVAGAVTMLSGWDVVHSNVASAPVLSVTAVAEEIGLALQVSAAAQAAADRWIIRADTTVAP